jgi:hypothetical protein
MQAFSIQAVASHIEHAVEACAVVPRRSAWRALEKSLRNGGDPRKVADLILNVAIARTPRLRYGAGNEARWLPLMKVLLPQRLFDHLLRRAYGRRNPANFGLSPDDQHPP